MSEKQTAWEIYREELAKLAAINRAQDFSAQGDEMYLEQYDRTKDAYLAACLESEAQARVEFEGKES